MPDPNSFVVPANAGPHTPRSIVSNAHSENFLLNKCRWLWVPAFAGTTMEEQHSRHLRRHCERSEAIHSSFFAPRDGLLRGACHRAHIRATRWLAMTLLWFWIRLHPRGAKRPRCAFISRPLEGVGNAGCPLHPRPRVHLVVVERTRVTTSTPESPGIPARNGFNGLLRALPGDRALLPPSSADMFLSKPGWADLNSANLTPASGRQDHTTSPSAATSLVRTLGDRSQAETCPATSSRAKRCRVHRIPPRVS